MAKDIETLHFKPDADDMQSSHTELNDMDRDAGGWIEWHGGECPVNGDTVVEVLFEIGETKKSEYPTIFNWTGHYKNKSPIIAYRIVQPSPTVAVKHDDGKLPYHLVPSDALEEIIKVLAFGAKKYGDNNWATGMNWSRCFSACMRHLWAWWRGESKDSETGLPHLAHAGCCILFMIAYELRGVGKDDR